MISLAKYPLFLLVLLQFFSFQEKGCASTFDTNNPINGYTLATYNIRYATKEDEGTGNGWDKRKRHVVGLIKDHDMDVVGTQEGDNLQIQYMAEQLHKYAHTKEGYGSESGSHNAAIFYKKEKFTLLDQGHFWMSETPEVKSKGWDASDYRITNWVKLQDKTTGKEFFFFNTHFYWRKQVAKEMSGVLIASKMREIAGNTPIICVGDFNSLPESKQIQDIEKELTDSYKRSPIHQNKVVGTGFPGGVFTGVSDKRIDYVFVSKEVDVHSYEADNATYDENRYPSDHLPIIVTLSIN